MSNMDEKGTKKIDLKFDDSGLPINNLSPERIEELEKIAMPLLDELIRQREGAGRKEGTKLVPYETTVMRVPTPLKSEFEKRIEEFKAKAS